VLAPVHPPEAGVTVGSLVAFETGLRCGLSQEPSLAGDAPHDCLVEP
jgi:hypothetical protein